MRGTIPDDTIEEIKRRADIVDIISAHVTLKQRGRNFLGLCPFHQEKTPSFTVTPDKQIFYCFGCSQGGTVIDFLMKINQMSFPEALRFLAAKTGVTIPEKPLSPEDRERLSVREQLLRVNETAAAHFSRNLISPLGREGIDYLRKRGISEEITKTFRLGFAPNGWRNLRDHLERQKVSLKLAEEAGLLIAKEDGSFYDRFRGRLIFPITDTNGRVIAFGGRIMGDGEPKYLNSPESPVYVKGRHLYGLALSREEIRTKGSAILVEGYFDLISLWGSGMRNVVASLGTALTRDQVDLIRRQAPQVAIVFDPDEAGRKALDRSVELLLAGNVGAKAVVLPEGNDPDTYIRAFGREGLEGLIAAAPSLVDYYIETVIGQGGTLEKDRQIVKNAVPFITRIADPIERNLFVKRVAEKLGIEQALLMKEIQKALKPDMGGKREASRPKAAGIDAVEFNLIRIMLDYPVKIPLIEASGVLDCLVTEELQTIGQAIGTSYRRDGRIDASAFVAALPPSPVRDSLLQGMSKGSPFDDTVIERVVTDTIGQIKRKGFRERHRSLKQELQKAQEEGNMALGSSLLREKERLLQEEKLLQQGVTHH